MKTLFSFVSIFVLLTAAESLDAPQWDAGAFCLALAVAALFAFALNDSRRPERPLLLGRVERSPGSSRCSGARRIPSMDLAA